MTMPHGKRAPSRALMFITIGLSTALLSGSALGEAFPDPDDGIAKGSVAFFSAETGLCPSGWKVADYAMGRLVVGAASEAAVGKSVGLPLGDQEDRTHVHSYNTNVDLPYKSVAAADGANNQGAAAQTLMLSGQSEPATSGLPFVQLVVCEKL